jgi:hypothetical protein
MQSDDHSMTQKLLDSIGKLKADNGLKLQRLRLARNRLLQMQERIAARKPSKKPQPEERQKIAGLGPSPPLPLANPDNSTGP